MQLKHIFIVLLMLTLGVGMVSADEIFDPSNPPDPSAVFKLTMRSEPEGIGYVSGAGLFRAGTGVYLNTSGNSLDYQFKRWVIDGEEYFDMGQCTYFTMPHHDVEVVAEYEFVTFDPSSPSDPNARYLRRVFVESVPQGASSFNINSGERYEQGSEMYLQAMPNQGYVFDGWYIGTTKMADSMGFYYTIPESNTTLTARFTYNPSNPTDPTGGQTDVDNSGFVEATGIALDVNDASMCIGARRQLTATILPDDATYKNIYWYSSDPLVAKVNQKGEVTAVAEGTAVITATNGRFTDTCTVTVNNDSVPGDVNGDGDVSIIDITMMVSHILGKTPDAMLVDVADLNNDGDITIVDITLVINIILQR